MTMGTYVVAFLRQNGWLLNLAFIAFGAYFTAGAANALVAQRIGVRPSVEEALREFANRDRQKPGSRGEDGGVAFATMAQRNLLALEREDLTPAKPTQAAAPEAVVVADAFDDSELKPCTLPMSLRATVVFDENPTWSFAVMTNNSDHEPEIYTINEDSSEVTSDATLIEIRNREVVVRRRDHFERCVAEGEKPDQAAERPRPRIGMRNDEEDGDADPTSGVSKVSETEYNIDRGELDRVLSNLNEVATQARIVPSFKNGKANGFKLFSIKPGSIYAKIGLHNGDVIQKINGYEINSPDKALEIYQKLRDASHVSVDLQRRGRDMGFSYNIR